MGPRMDAEPRRYASPMPADARRGLRRVGAVAGALVGVGAAVTPPTLAFAVFGFAAASASWGDALGNPGTWLAAGIAAVGIALLAAAWFLSVTGARRWTARPRRLSAAAFAVTAAGALLLDALLVAAFFAFEGFGLAPTEWLLLAVAALLAIGVGAAVGALAWPWMAHLLRPAHPPLDR